MPRYIEANNCNPEYDERTKGDEMNKLIYKQIRAGFPITLHQTGLERFTVRYGLQERTNLTYVAAAKELGECIMHGLTNEGKLSEK